VEGAEGRQGRKRGGGLDFGYLSRAPSSHSYSTDAQRAVLLLNHQRRNNAEHLEQFITKSTGIRQSKAG